MGGAQDLLMVMLLLGGGYVLIKSGMLEQLSQGNFQLPAIPGLPAPAAPAPPAAGGGGRGGPGEAGGGGGGAGPGTAQGTPGDCVKTIYAATGQKVDNGKQTKNGTRHYASGKPDDVTQEWATKVSFKNYEFTAIATIGKIDHDDQFGMKFGGSHMNGGWYDCGLNFNGASCLGKEENHPSTDLCVVKGPSVGSIVGKKTGLKCIIVGAGTNAAEVELWADPGATGAWKKLIPRTKGIGGFFPTGSQECTIRIDAAPQITMHCCSVNEITGWTQGAGGGGGPPAAPAAPAGKPAPAAPAPEPDAEKKPADDAKKAEYGRVNRSYRSRARYY